MVEGGRLEIVLAVLSCHVGSNPTLSATQMSSPRQKEICLGLDYFLAYLPSCSNSDTNIRC